MRRPSASAIAFSQFFGQHGYLPELVDIAHDVNMHGTFVASGPGDPRPASPVAGVRAIDVAPTLAFLLGIDGPQNARGKILLNITTASATSGRSRSSTSATITDS